MVDSTGLAAFQSGNTDAALASALDAARTYCGWHLWPSREEELEVWAEPTSLVLPTLKLTGVTSAVQGAETLDEADLYLTSSGLVTRKTGAWRCDIPAVVTFTHGHVTMPSDLADAIYGRASQRITNPRGLTRVDIDQVISESYGSGGSTAASDAALNPYRLPIA